MSSIKCQIKGLIKAVSISKEKGTKKENVDSAFLKEDFGIVGDAHAQGGIRQVSLLAEESIEKMRQKGLDVNPGDFAENITTKGIDLTSLKIGTKLKIGTDAILNLTQFGKECHTRCNIYYQAGDCVMPREGVFARVIKGGTIKPKDKIEVIEDAKRTIVERSPERATHSTALRVVPSDSRGTKRVEGYKVAVLTISDRCSKGEREDKTGRVIQDLVKSLPAELVKYEIIPDEPALIKERLIDYADSLKVDLVLTNGGTGLGPRDFTPEATKAVIDRETSGITEAMRIDNLRFTKRAILSRATAGIRKKTLIVNLPGSPEAARQGLEFIKDALIHGIDMIRGKEH